MNLDGNSLGVTFSGIGGTLRAMEIYEDGNLLLMGGSAGLLVRKLDTGQQVQLLATQDITAIVVHPARGLAMIVSNAGRTITQVDLATVMQDQGRAVLETPRCRTCRRCRASRSRMATCICASGSTTA